MMKINKDDFILIKSGTCLDPDGNIMIRSSDLDEYSTSELDNNLLAQIFKLSNGQNLNWFEYYYFSMFDCKCSVSSVQLLKYEAYQQEKNIFLLVQQGYQVCPVEL